MLEMSYARRRLRLWRLLGKRRQAALLLSHPPNLRYLCGFTGSAGVLALAAEESCFFTDGRYRQQAHDEVQGAGLLIAAAPLAAALDWLARRRPASLGVEGNHLSFAEAGTLTRALDPRTRLVDVSDALAQLRMRKDAQELQALRAAARLGSGLFGVALEVIRPGVRECEVAAAMEFAARSQGADGMSFTTIVAGGKRSALPHGRASAAPLPRRGYVVLDFGVILSGYCSDMTRTVHLGRPDARARRMHEAVRQAQKAAISAVGPGRRFSEVDRAARTVLAGYGLARYFTHSTGHGVGLEIHEPPRLAGEQKGSLQPGMVITIEPGVYIAGRGGVRIEDMVLVKSGGAELLTSGATELLVL